MTPTHTRGSTRPLPTGPAPRHDVHRPRRRKGLRAFLPHRPVPAAPVYRYLGAGLLVTSTSVWAAFLLRPTRAATANPSVQARNEHTYTHLPTALGHHRFTLRVFWHADTTTRDRDEGGYYRPRSHDGTPILNAPTSPAALAAADIHAVMEALDLPARSTLLTVHLDDLEPDTPINPSNLGAWQHQKDAVHRQLASAGIHPLVATSDQIAWILARETHRSVPSRSTIPTTTRTNEATATHGGVSASQLPAIEAPSTHTGVHADIDGHALNIGVNLSRPHYAGAALTACTYSHATPHPHHLVFTDETGHGATYACHLALTDLPDTTQTPAQAWITNLTALTTPPIDVPSHDGPVPVAVMPEITVHAQALTPSQASTFAASLAKKGGEQRRAAHRADPTTTSDPAAALTERDGQALKHTLPTGETLVTLDVRITVTAPTMGMLTAKTHTLVAACTQMGFTATILADQQHLGFIDTLPGATPAISDVTHTVNNTFLAHSGYYVGAATGYPHSYAPVVGVTTDATHTPVRFSLLDATTRGDAPVTLYLGRTRRGKTTALMVDVLNVHAHPEQGQASHNELSPTTISPTAPVSVVLDVKGDLTGLVPAAHRYTIPAQTLTLDGTTPGALDAFATSPTYVATDHAVAQLSLLLPPHLAARAEHLLITAANAVVKAHGTYNLPQDTHPDDIDIDAATHRPWQGVRNWQIIDHLAVQAETTGDPLTRSVADALIAASADGAGALVAGRPHHTATADAGPSRSKHNATAAEGPRQADVAKDVHVQGGITVVRLPNLSLPTPGQDPTTRTYPQRRSLAALRGALTWCAHLVTDPTNLARHRVIAVPEAHVLTATADGAQFIEHLARMMAAHGAVMALDTQDATGITAHPGLVEATSAVWMFATTTPEEHAAAATLTGLPASGELAQLLTSLDAPTGEDPTTVRRGHALYRDTSGATATVQRLLHPHLLALLDTSPNRTT